LLQAALRVREQSSLINLEAGYRFQSGVISDDEECSRLRIADRIYYGVGEGDGELVWASDDSAFGDAMALIFLRASSRRRCCSAPRSSVPMFLSAARGFNNARSRMRA